MQHLSLLASWDASADDFGWCVPCGLGKVGSELCSRPLAIWLLNGLGFLEAILVLERQKQSKLMQKCLKFLRQSKKKNRRTSRSFGLWDPTKVETSQNWRIHEEELFFSWILLSVSLNREWFSKCQCTSRRNRRSTSFKEPSEQKNRA